MTALFVANAGGHLVELLQLSRRLPIDIDDSVWVTFDSPQSRSLLAGREVVYVRYPTPRDLLATLSNGVAALRLHRRRRFTHAFSTGAGVAVSFLPISRALGASAHYIESATRISGPSMTGRLLRAVPGIHLHTQTDTWAGRTWRYAGSVFDGFRAEEAGGAHRLRRVAVTVGSSETYGFRRLLERVVAILPPGVEVLWQTGSTPLDALPIVARPQLPALELEAALREADVVIAHAGVGTALTALTVGRLPILVPREKAHGEHVDDHQFEIARELERRGLALNRRVEELTATDLFTAASRRVAPLHQPPPFLLS